MPRPADANDLQENAYVSNSTVLQATDISKIDYQPLDCVVWIPLCHFSEPDVRRFSSSPSSGLRR
jgi:hypothetical protein